MSDINPSPLNEDGSLVYTVYIRLDQPTAKDQIVTFAAIEDAVTGAVAPLFSDTPCVTATDT